MIAKRYIRFSSTDFYFEITVVVKKLSVGYNIEESYEFKHNEYSRETYNRSSYYLWTDPIEDVASKVFNEKIKDVSWRKFGNNDYIHKNFLKY